MQAVSPLVSSLLSKRIQFEAGLVTMLFFAHVACYAHDWYIERYNSIGDHVTSLTLAVAPLQLLLDIKKGHFDWASRALLLVYAIITFRLLYDSYTYTKKSNVLPSSLPMKEGEDISTQLLLQEELGEKKFTPHPEYPLTVEILKAITTISHQNKTFFGEVLIPLIQAYRENEEGQLSPYHSICERLLLGQIDLNLEDLTELAKFSICLQNGTFIKT